jgi:hypothetical protein
MAGLAEWGLCGWRCVVWVVDAGFFRDGRWRLCSSSFDVQRAKPILSLLLPGPQLCSGHTQRQNYSSMSSAIYMFGIEAQLHRCIHVDVTIAV